MKLHMFKPQQLEDNLLIWAAKTGMLCVIFLKFGYYVSLDNDQDVLFVVE